MRALPNVILLATDGTDTTAVALRAAADLAHRGRAALHVAHVWGDPFAGLMPPEATTEMQGALATALAQTEQERVESLGQPVAKVHTPHGIRGHELLRIAARERATLIVVGGRKPGFLAEILTARVSQAVIRRAGVPVLLVPMTAHWPPKRIVAAFDSTAQLDALAHLTAWLAGALGLGVVLVHVVQPHARLSDGETLDHMAAFLDATSTMGGPDTIDANVLRGGSITHALLDVSGGGSDALLIMGMREPRQLVHEGRHNVAEDVSRHSHQPVVLVPEPQPRRDEQGHLSLLASDLGRLPGTVLGAASTPYARASSPGGAVDLEEPP